jgi:putative two-component system response regulator
MHPMAHTAAVCVIAEGDGRTSPAHFDPAILAAFVRDTEYFEEIFEENHDDPSAAD